MMVKSKLHQIRYCQLSTSRHTSTLHSTYRHIAQHFVPFKNTFTITTVFNLLLDTNTLWTFLCCEEICIPLQKKKHDV